MPIALMLLFQAMQAQAPPSSTPPDDVAALPLPRITPDGRCASPDAEEIVICGSRGATDRYRLRPLAPGYEPRRVEAETGLARGVAGSIHADAVELAPGLTSKRFLVTIKTKF